MKKVGFIISRYVNDTRSARYWQACYNHIRKFYDEPIVFIDNGSNASLLESAPSDCRIINAEFPHNRLFSPFYVFTKEDFDFDIAVIIHDGIIMTDFVNFLDIDRSKFIWHFDTHDYDVYHLEMSQITALNNCSYLVDLYKSKKWKGCMGAMSAVSKEFMSMLQDKYNILALKDKIQNQADAIAFERVFAVLCYSEIDNFNKCPSFMGDISQMKWGYRYEDYLRDLSRGKFDGGPIIKIFGARK